MGAGKRVGYLQQCSTHRGGGSALHFTHSDECKATPHAPKDTLSAI